MCDRLERAYGKPSWRPRYGPLDELIFTVLTQHTSDANAEIAFESLRTRFPTWTGVMEADSAAVAEAIRRGGLSNQKAPRIQGILREVLARRDNFDLRFLKTMPLTEAKAWLSSLPGVGPKTAAVVLAFALGMPAMPVDTHIFRVGRRLGLIPLDIAAEPAHDVMEGQVPPERVFDYHVLLITHGRRICKAQRPLCPECPLADLCPSAPIFEKARARATFRRPVRGGRPL